MSARECPGCGLTIRTPDDADRDDDARLCPDGRCHGTDALSRVRASRAGGYSTLDLDPRDVDAVLSALDAAEAECVRLRAIVERLTFRDSILSRDRDALTSERDHYRERARSLRERFDRVQSVAAAAMREGLACAEWQRVCLASERGRSAVARAEAARLRAIVEGRTAPTPDDAAAHALARPLPTPGAASNGATCDEPVGLWLCVVDGEGAVVLRLARESDDQGLYLMAWSSDYGWCGTGDIRRAWPLDASGRPCPWPTALDAGEGR